MRYFSLIAFCLAACSQAPVQQSHLLASLCGNTYQGTVVSDDPQDADWRQEVLTLGPVQCAEGDLFELPLAVGEDKSRTWFINGSGESLALRHQHLLKDGSVDPVSDYGGPISGRPQKSGETWTMDFPADAKTVAIFKANGLEVSISNVWTLEITPDESFSYELNRENRHFRAEFDLANPL